MLLSKSTTKNLWKSIIILIIGFSITFILSFYTYRNTEKQTNKEFALICNEIKTTINSRLHAHAQLLRSGASLFGASDTITRQDWKEFNKHEQIHENLPGIQGVGYSMIISKNQLETHIKDIQAQGFSDYTIKPAGERDIYTSIIYLEPFEGRNLRAFGYDMYSEPVRRAAMQQACDSDVAALSDKVILVQETDKDLQAGTLMYVPVYKNGKLTNTVAQRRSAIIGWVYSPYRMNDLMKGILGGWDSINSKRIRLQIYDDKNISDNLLLFDSQSKDSIKDKDIISRNIILTIDFNGQIWLLNFTQIEEQFLFIKSKVIIVIFSGIVISLLLSGLYLSLKNTKKWANEISKQLTKELRESELRFKNIFSNHSSVMLLIEHKNGNIIDANKAASNFYGYSIEQLCKMSINEINTLSPEQIVQEIKKALTINSNYFIFTHKLANNEVRIVEVHSSPIMYDGEQILFSIIHDITERKNAELNLHKITTELQVTLATVTVGISYIKDRKVVWANVAHDEIFGYEIGKTQGMETSIFYIDKKNFEEFGKNAYLQLSTQNFYYQELKMRKKDGTQFWCSLTGRLINNSKVDDGTIWMIQDISERIQSEKEIRENQAQISAILNAIPDMMFILNKEGVYIDYHVPKTAELYAPPEVFLGKNIEQILPKEISDAFKIVLTKAIDSKLVEIFEYSLPYSQGISFYESRTIVFQEDKILTIIRDITERKKSEILIEKQHNELEKLNTDKDRFMSILAHDLRSPFNSIFGFLELLLSNIDKYDKDKIKFFINLINDSSRRFYNLLEDLLLWVRSQSGKIPYNPRIINFVDVCTKTIEILNESAKNKNITINCLANKEINIFADINMLNTILRNLIANAIKFTNNDGWIKIFAEENENFVTITIADNGIGIPQNLIAKLFDISQVYTTNGTAEETGTGLGLLICKEFVQKNGGKIWVESETGKGSKFKFTLNSRI